MTPSFPLAACLFPDLARRYRGRLSLLPEWGRVFGGDQGGSVGVVDALFKDAAVCGGDQGGSLGIVGLSFKDAAAFMRQASRPDRILTARDPDAQPRAPPAEQSSPKRRPKEGTPILDCRLPVLTGRRGASSGHGQGLGKRRVGRSETCAKGAPCGAEGASGIRRLGGTARVAGVPDWSGGGLGEAGVPRGGRVDSEKTVASTGPGVLSGVGRCYTSLRARSTDRLVTTLFGIVRNV